MKPTFIRLRSGALVILLFLGVMVSGQSILQLSFTAIYGSDFLPLDSIHIRNISQGGDTVLVYPDTLLLVDLISGVENYPTPVHPGLRIGQNHPNPFSGHTTFELFLDKERDVMLYASGLQGRSLLQWHGSLPAGTSSFQFSTGQAGTFFITALNGGHTQTIMVVSQGSKAVNHSLKRMGTTAESSHPTYKATKSQFYIGNGDELLLVGYADGEESGTIRFADSSQTVPFQFATNIPCPGLHSFVYGGLEYNTLQVRSQCWMKENMNYETANSSCIYNNPNNCDTYGRLYPWEATQDLCPPGWHLPSDNEWKVLEGVADSQYSILDPVWDYPGNWRGFDAGTNIKSTSGWYDNGNGLDLYGFSAPPGGYQLFVGTYGGASIEIGYWTSTEEGSTHAWERFLHFNKGGVHRHAFVKEWGLYVRCVRD